ncbi:MAG TPA: HepT-like ribonuclease domain-containing protein [Hyphomicrobiales bacterium]|nr:HepT-like ribonuclease domain-containing protein [Hyphomicrobiales bacterium]
MPSENANQVALLDIADNIHLAQSFVEGMTYDAFRDSKLHFYATRCLEIISEASRRLSAEAQQRQAHIPWRKIATAGTIYRHDYEDVQQQLVWGRHPMICRRFSRR